MSGAGPVPARDAAVEVARALAAGGFRALFAGGCVRDALMGREPVDFDIATDARPDEIKSVFPKARGVGEAFGVMLVRHRGHTFEVATFRKDGPYHDGRRPSEVLFADEREDAARRDFTVNGIFAEPESGEPVDYVEGRSDIERRLIRAIGDPHARIREDRLRMLRAVRFAARLGFEIDGSTAAAIRAHASELLAVSPERVGDEVRRMLDHPARARAASLVEELGLDGAIFGVARGGGALARLAALPAERAWTTALAAWQLDRSMIGDIPQAWGEAAIRAAIAGLRRSLTLSNQQTDAVASALSVRDALIESVEALRPAHRLRVSPSPGFDAAVDLLSCEAGAVGDRWRAEADDLLPTRALPEPLVDGNMLLASGLRPGPLFKRLLDMVMDEQLEGRLRSREEALAYALAEAGRISGNA